MKERWVQEAKFPENIGQSRGFKVWKALQSLEELVKMHIHGCHHGHSDLICGTQACDFLSGSLSHSLSL